MMKLRFLGHAAVLIRLKNTNLVIDPFITDNPSCAVELRDLPKIDYILVTHGHSDHLGDTVEIAKRDEATVIANFELCAHLSKKRVTTHPMHIGGTFNFPFGTVKMTPAIHGSSLTDGDTLLYAGNPCGFLLNLEGKMIYHAGDTGLTKDMELLEEEGVEVAFLPIGGNFVMDAWDALRAVKMIKPKKVVPIHFNTWDVIKADSEKFCEEVKKIGRECLVLNPGDTLEL